MVWCYNCTRHQPAQSGCSSSVCCNGCGKVVNQDTASNALSNSLQVASDKVTGNCGRFWIQGFLEFTLVFPKFCKNEVNSLNADKSLRFDAAKFIASRTVSKNAKSALMEKGSNDSEKLCNIDDAEIGRYLLKEDEKFFKKIIWERMNDDYTMAEVARKAEAANGMKFKKEKQTQAAEAKKTRGTAKTANKRTSSRVNYDRLEELLGESDASDKSKKSRTDLYSEDGAMLNKNESGLNQFTDWGMNAMAEQFDDEGNNAKYQTDRYDDFDEEDNYSDDNGIGLF